MIDSSIISFAAFSQQHSQIILLFVKKITCTFLLTQMMYTTRLCSIQVTSIFFVINYCRYKFSMHFTAMCCTQSCHRTTKDNAVCKYNCH